MEFLLGAPLTLRLGPEEILQLQEKEVDFK